MPQQVDSPRKRHDWQTVIVDEPPAILLLTFRRALAEDHGDLLTILLQRRDILGRKLRRPGALRSLVPVRHERDHAVAPAQNRRHERHERQRRDEHDTLVLEKLGEFLLGANRYPLERDPPTPRGVAKPPYLHVAGRLGAAIETDRRPGPHPVFDPWSRQELVIYRL